jgi:hypothetical protein
MRACTLRHGASQCVAGRARDQAVEARLGAAQGWERGAEGPQRLWSTAEAPKRPYAGGTRGRCVARGAVTRGQRESVVRSADRPCSFPFTLLRNCLTPKSAN